MRWDLQGKRVGPGRQSHRGTHFVRGMMDCVPPGGAPLHRVSVVRRGWYCAKCRVPVVGAGPPFLLVPGQEHPLRRRPGISARRRLCLDLEG